MDATTESLEASSEINGLVPRYLRERQAVAAFMRAAAEAAAANRPPPPPSPEVAELLRMMRPVDAVTPDLRRRIQAAHPNRARLAGSAVAGMAFFAGLLIDH